MEINAVENALREKVAKIEEIENWYNAENKKIDKWYKEAGKTFDEWFKKETNTIKKWHEEISSSNQVELSKKKNRLEELDVSNLPRNKDNTISQRSNAAKEAVRLLDEIPKLQDKQLSLSKELSLKEVNLKNEYEKKKAPISEELNGKKSILSNDKKDQIGPLPNEVETLLKKFFNQRANDHEILNKVQQKYQKEEAFTDFEKLFKNLQETPKQEVMSDENITEIINTYYSKCKKQDFKIVFPNKNIFFNLLYRNEYTKIKKRIHYMRYYLFYVWVPLGLFVGIIESPETKNLTQTLGVIAIILSSLWPFTFIYSFFYKREKRKVYKENLDSFTSAKVRLDGHLSTFLKSTMLSKINAVVGKRCDDFVNKIEG